MDIDFIMSVRKGWKGWGGGGERWEQASSLSIMGHSCYGFYLLSLGWG